MLVRLLSLQGAGLGLVPHTSTLEPAHWRSTLHAAYRHTFHTIDRGELAVTCAKSHSVAIATVAAAQDACTMRRQSLGVIWYDKKPDLLTLEHTKELERMCVSVLSGRTLPSVQFGYGLDAHQFCFFGLEDMDSSELNVIQDQRMRLANEHGELLEWASCFDRIHISAHDVENVSNELVDALKPKLCAIDCIEAESLTKALLT